MMSRRALTDLANSLIIGTSSRPSAVVSDFRLREMTVQFFGSAALTIATHRVGHVLNEFFFLAVRSLHNSLHPLKVGPDGAGQGTWAPSGRFHAMWFGLDGAIVSTALIHVQAIL
ncbi:hypothetical protein AGR13a_Lc90075 [Agrobacterium genomosp. 13 str. CFBP 6927]|uniref:Uncharacterized protein n=1 Tax=Agrobacterium genomosp. 13 str. CFBP 6927 TaxID=1183428 RepID=A0ABM9VMX6_9HYPH|nr:hypothetical protein AGR13a_Lc90075 [Agrobacterium genomosp. 13 str. CFBP 6927]